MAYSERGREFTFAKNVVEDVRGMRTSSGGHWATLIRRPGVAW